MSAYTEYSSEGKEGQEYSQRSLEESPVTRPISSTLLNDQLKEQLMKLDSFLECFSNSTKAFLAELEYSFQHSRAFPFPWHKPDSTTIQQGSITRVKSKVATSERGDYVGLSVNDAWGITKVWRLLVVLQRYLVLATALSVVSKAQYDSTPQGFPTELTINDPLQELGEREVIRFLFLHCESFRILVAVCEWCEWVGRMEDFDENRREQGTVGLTLVGNGDLHYAETCYQLEREYNCKRGPEPPAFYHLDLPTTLLANATTKQSQPQSLRRSRTIPSNTSIFIDPHDLEKATQLYKIIWRYITNGRVEDLKRYLDQVGEPWMKTIIEGQEPLSDPDSIATKFYNNALANLPPEVSNLLNCEIEIENESSLVFDRISKRFRVDENNHDASPHKNALIDRNTDSDLCAWQHHTWISRVLFESTSAVVKSMSHRQGEVEEHPDGNRWSRLMINVAQTVVNDKNSLNVYEKALYGYFCGSLSSMVPACQTWKEFIWANCIDMRERIIRQFIGRRGEWKTVLSEWNSINTGKLIEGVFQTAESRFGETTQSDNMIRFIIRKWIAAQHLPSSLIDVVKYLVNQASNPLSLRSSNIRDYGINSAQNYIVNERERSFHFWKFIREFVITMKRTTSKKFDVRKDEEDWTTECDRLLWIWLSKQPPYETPETVDDAIFVFRYMSPDRRIEAAVAWLLSKADKISNPSENLNALELLQFAIHKSIDVFQETFLVIILRLAAVVWETQKPDEESLPHHREIQNRRSVLLLTLLTLSYSVAYSDWARQIRGSLSNALKESLEVMFSWISRQQQQHHSLLSMREVITIVAEMVEKDLHFSSGQSNVSLEAMDGAATLDLVSQIDLLTFFIALAAPLVNLLAKESISKKSVVRRQVQSDGSSSITEFLAQGHMMEQLQVNYHEKLLHPELPAITSQEGKSTSPSISTFFNDEIAEDEGLAFCIDMLDQQLLEPSIELIDTLLQGQADDGDDDDDDNGNDKNEAREVHDNSLEREVNRKNSKGYSAAALNALEYHQCNEKRKRQKTKRSIRDILLTFPDTVPPFLRSYSPQNESVPHPSVSSSLTGENLHEWDSISPTKGISLCLSPLLHYFAIRQYLDILLGLKDFHILLIDSIYKLAARRQPDIRELTSLGDRLANSFQFGYPRSPYINRLLSLRSNVGSSSPSVSSNRQIYVHPLASIAKALVPAEEIVAIEESSLNSLIFLIIATFSKFTEAACALPEGNRRPSSWLSIKESTLNVLVSAATAVDKQSAIFSIEARASLETIVLKVRTLFRSNLS